MGPVIRPSVLEGVAWPSSGAQRCWKQLRLPGLGESMWPDQTVFDLITAQIAGQQTFA